MPHFPPSIMKNVFLIIESEIRKREKEALNEFLSYVKENYLGYITVEGDIKNGRVLINNWSCYNRTLNHVPRTTNNAEAWNMAFNEAYVVCHPNISVVFEVMKDFEG
jgi:hypothetical protein